MASICALDNLSDSCIIRILWCFSEKGRNRMILYSHNCEVRWLLYNCFPSWNYIWVSLLAEALIFKVVNFISCSKRKAETSNFAKWFLLGLSFRFCKGNSPFWLIMTFVLREAGRLPQVLITSVCFPNLKPCWGLHPHFLGQGELTPSWSTGNCYLGTLLIQFRNMCTT